MPHINRIRVNNVRYNFGTQFYDDFVMRFDGRNALYDLANGGGKSVLMLLLFQNLIPNCSLDDKQPIEKLFRTDQGSSVIHSLVEWKLDDRFEFDGYKYMLTGFCARKAREELKDTAAIEYFNYVIFYRNYNENDLVHLPLTEGKTRVTYTGLRSYLRELGRRDMRLEVKVFERKGEYQRFIKNYGLYESHWEILRGINKTEGHVRTWFETHYRTTRKVVEDLLIEDIIAPTYAGSSTGDTDMADTLLAIREQLVDLAKRKEQMRYYDKQMEILNRFSEQVGSLAGIYSEEQAAEDDMIRLYNSAKEQYKHCMNDLNYREKEKALAVRRIKEIEKKIASARIMADEEKCNQAAQEILTMEAALEADQTAREKLQSDIAIAESMEDLTEAQAFLREAKALEIEAENGDADPMEIEKRLRELAAIRYSMLEVQKQENKAQCEKLESQIHELISQISQHEASARKAIGDLAVADSQCGQAQTAYALHKARWQEVSKNVTAEQALQTKAFLNQAVQESETLKASLTEAELHKEQLTEQISENEKKLSEITAKRMLLLAEHDRTAAFFQAHEHEQEKLEKLKQIYRASDADQLTQILNDQLHRVIRDLEKKKEQLAEYEKHLAACTNGSGIVSDACEQIMTYLRSCYDVRCVFGGDYLAELDADMQQQLLHRLPYLSGAVLTDGDVAAIEKDPELSSMDLAGAVVPVISLAEVMETKDDLSKSGVFFVTDGHLYYRNEEAKEALIKRLQTQIENSQKEISRAYDREEIIEADRKWLYGYMEIYVSGLMAKEAERRNKQAELEKLTQAENSVSEHLAKDREARRVCETTLASGQKKLQSLLEDIEYLKDLAAEEEAVDLAEKEVQTQKRAAEEAKRLKELYDQRLTEAKEQQQSLDKAHQQIKAKEEQAQKEWQQLYAPYFTSEMTIEAPNGEWDDEKLYAEFSGLKAAAQKQLGDVTAKRQLAEGKRQMAEALYKNIRKRGLDPEQVKVLAVEQNLTVDIADLLQMSMKAEKLAEKISENEQKLRAAMLARERMAGSLSYEKQNAEELYGVLSYVNIAGGDYEAYIALEKEALAAQRIKADEEEKNIQSAMRYVRVAEDTKKDIERMMEAEQIAVGRITESLPAGTDLKSAGARIRRVYAQMKQALMNRREVYLDDRQKAVESLTHLEAVELASTLKGIAMPQNALEADQLMANLEDTAKIIGLEKERIAGAIHDMEQIKGNFEKQCLQRCVSIKAELERFPMYSKINMDGKQVPMIRLRIPYVSDTQYEERMAAYIDDIVASTDRLDTQEERADYIHRQLSMKRLFSVIVEDMNMIRLNLYKRERIREQSRYLRYEEAVGSTGQSQGIYIQFLIGVINYIAMVTSGGEDGSNMKKVIFIDNPFGAARDIYIWQPIFELLKANQVQLIVPTRGATPAITGMFDVNYILGQRMIDRVQQTVVVDYNSCVDVDQMNFEPIEFEQQVFDFV